MVINPEIKVLPTSSTQLSLNTELSEWIALLHNQSLSLSWTDFKPWCFRHLQKLCPFDSGLWWSRSDLADKEHAHWAEDTSLFNQSVEFMQNYADIAARPNNPDPLNRHLNTNPGTFFSIWDVMDKARWYQTDYYKEHCALYGIENAISVLTLPSSCSNVSHIFSFYRQRAEHEFTVAEKSLLGSLLPHLLQAFSCNLLSSLSHANQAALSGVIDRYGEIIVAEEGLRQFMLDKGMLAGNRITLPNLQYISGPTKLQLDDMALDLSFHEGLIALQVHQSSLAAKLTPRQKEICQLITKGLSNKEIAHLLGLKISTINNHVQQAFKVLKVHTREAATAYLVKLELC